MDDRWKLGGTFIYGTGNAITVPSQRYFLDGNLLGCLRPAKRLPNARLSQGGLRRHPHQPEPKAEKERTANGSSRCTTSTTDSNPYFIYFGNEGAI